MTSVESSAISAIGHDSQTLQMTIVFTSSNKTYNHCNVPRSVYEALRNASSKGTHYDKNIKGKYNC